MKIIAKDARLLEERLKALGISEELMMENAGFRLKELVKPFKNPLFILGKGSNAADGLVAARMLKKATCLRLFDKESPAFKTQLERAVNVTFIKSKADLSSYDCIIDCIFGTGLKKEISKDIKDFILRLNELKAYKIACDLPSAMLFKADITLCMGVYKAILYEDIYKELSKEIKLANLGIARLLSFSSVYLIQNKELRLITRKEGSNKGDFGHIFIKASQSAGQIAALAALNAGAGKLSLQAKGSLNPLIIKAKKLDKKASVYAIGMGLEKLDILKEDFLKNKRLVLDGNCFNSALILPFLHKNDCIITPHPKEFCKLYKLCFKKSLDMKDLKANSIFYARSFSKHYACILVLKGSNTKIAKKGRVFVITKGSKALAKAGSGDALAGIIAAYLANFSPLKAAIFASLVHAKASKYKYNPNSFDALKLIKNLKYLKP